MDPTSNSRSGRPPISLLESTASEAIARLTLTSANYKEAVATLKQIGNRQSIINRSMDLLLYLEAMSSIYNLKGLRYLFDAVESNVRGLRALGAAASSYGGLLSSILMARLPAELHLMVSRRLSEDEWDPESVMKIFQREIQDRGHSAGATLSQTRKPLPQKPPQTALSLTIGAASSSTSGHCYVCLRRNHLDQNCRSSSRCAKCNRRHHTSICRTYIPGATSAPAMLWDSSLSLQENSPCANHIFNVCEFPYTYPTPNCQGDGV